MQLAEPLRGTPAQHVSAQFTAGAAVAGSGVEFLLAVAGFAEAAGVEIFFFDEARGYEGAEDGVLGAAG